MRKSGLLIAISAAFVLALATRPAAHALDKNPGISTVCGEFTIALDLFIGSIDILDRPDEAWAYVDPAQKIRTVTGIAHGVHVAANDTPANHDSHDADFEVRLDPEQEDLISVIQTDSIGIEWETGIDPSELAGDGAHPTYPKWAWPSDGDRVWVNGNWIFDCGHPSSGLYHTEIHPPRAIAVLRDQAAPLPGTGVTPVPVTLTDVYITGRGGYTPNQLNCGPNIVLGDHGDTCGESTPPADDSYKTTPINTNFTFPVCLPPRPANAVLSTSHEAGPRNTVSIDPQISDLVPAGGGCLGDLRYDQSVMIQVTIPLNGTAVTPQDVYARRIYAGWILAPDPALEHRRVTVNSTNLHEDHDLDPGDGELTFWWVNANRAPYAWLRLSDYANGNMDDYDDDFALGDGEMSYTGALFDFYLRDGQTFSVRSRGYEQDCFDTFGDFGYHYLSLAMYAACYADLPNFGASDPIADADRTFNASSLGDRTLDSGGDEYEMRVTINAVPLEFEDTSYLSIHTACTPSGEVALVGQPLTCATRADNAGPGLPRNVTITANVGGGTASAEINSGTWSVRAPFGNGTYPCTAFGTESTCHPDGVPVAAAAPVNVATTVTPSSTGMLMEQVEVRSPSADPDLTDNVASTSLEVFRSVALDVEPSDATNVINLKRRGTVTVAILGTADFDVASVDPSSVCFGDAEAPAERACTEVHGTGHIDDVNKDRRPDLVFHFDVAATGIDAGDQSACLKGRTTAGVGFYACNVIVTK